ncbi:trypsin-like peptidase domain-containing protein [Streptomyces sp. NPDC057686]|uniref:nSTAND1 domain-containing NTPase n=1 Tax=Streptomyces sp. NPDC057686 TaxID=3346212 RepID=UPI0036BD0E5B
MLRIRDGRGDTVGLGFLVTADLALTCAHVVSAALGLPEDVEPDASARLDIGLPLQPPAAGDGPGATASVECWLPPRSSSGTGDVAVLRLSAPLPGSHPLRLVGAQDVWGHPARAFGFPHGRPGGVWHSGVLRARQANGWVQVDLAARGYRVSRGFSGGPVWDDKLAGVVGMMAVAETGDPAASYLIPTDGLLSAVPQLRDLVLPPSPYRSLSPFREADAQVFHGREPETAELVAMLARNRWTTVVGPSGSGKSSLAMAGVLPRIRASGDITVVLRPASGGNPLSALAAALLPLLEPELSETQRLERIPALANLLRRQGPADMVRRLLELHGGNRLLVLVDQFEELLALAPVAVDELAEVLFDEALPTTVRVLTTLRADFLEAVLAHPRLGHVLSRQVYALGPMSGGQLREIVTAPVDAIPGVSYEPHLVDRILADTSSEPGALALLGFTLDLLWQRQGGGALTHQAYEQLGGVPGALGAHADQVWGEQVAPEDEPAARRLFTQLIRVPLESAAATRRTALRSELGEDEWQIAQRLAATRLLVAGRSPEDSETVELSHEALITGWSKLGAWAAEDRSFLVWRETLRHDRQRWERGGRAVELLPTAIALDAARHWLSERGSDLTEAERGYLDLGRGRLRSRNRRRTALLSGIGTVVALALVLTSLFFSAQEQGRRQKTLALSRGLTQMAQSEKPYDATLSAMLALAAYKTSPTQEARNELLQQYISYSGSTRELSGVPGKIRWMQTSKDGNVVIAVSDLSGAFVFVHALNGQVRSEKVAADLKLDDAQVSADGKRAALVRHDGTVLWFDITTTGGTIAGPLHELPRVEDMGPGSHGGSRAAFSADGRMIATRVMNGTPSSTATGRLVWWNLDSGSVAGTVPAPFYMATLLRFGADGHSFLVDTFHNKAGLEAVDMATGTARTVVDQVGGTTPSGDGTVAVVCNVEGAEGEQTAVYHRLRISDGSALGSPYRVKTSVCLIGGVDGSGSKVLLGPSLLRLVDLDRGAIAAEAPGPKGSYVYIGGLISAGGKFTAVGWSDARITYTEVSEPVAVLDVAQQVLTADATKTITILGDGSRLQLRRTPGDQLLAEVPRPEPFWDTTNSPLRQTRDGTLFADRDGKNTVSVRTVSDLRQVVRISAAMPPTGDPKNLDFTFFFDMDNHLVTLSGTRIQQWDPHTGRQLAQFDTAAFHPRNDSKGKGIPQVVVTAFPAPNQVAVLVLDDPVVRIVDIVTGRTVTTVRTAADAVFIRFDTSGRYFALSRGQSHLELWQREPDRRQISPLRSVSESADTPVAGAFIDGEGTFLMAANGSVQIFDVAHRTLRDSYVFGRPGDNGRGVLSRGAFSFMDVSRDGRTVIYADADGKGGPLVLDPDRWQRELCGIIGYREFTAEERGSLPVKPPERQVCTAP